MINKYSLLCIITLLSTSIYAAPGCMDNSYHLTQKFDNKEYHYVQCNCPCEKEYKIMPARAQCAKCLHCRVPKSMIFVSYQYEVPYSALSYDTVVTVQTQDASLNTLFGNLNYNK